MLSQSALREDMGPNDISVQPLVAGAQLSACGHMACGQADTVVAS
jgi:hypothetical protein